MRATVDLIGMYNYDNTVLDLMQIPEALDRQTLIDNLLMESAEMELLYNNVGFLKQAIGSWSRKNITVWNELYDTTQYEYNPIWNVDGKVVEGHDLKGTDYLTDDHTTTRTHTDTITRTHNDTVTMNKGAGSTNTHSVYGFNSSTDAPADKDVLTTNGNDSDVHTGTTTDAHTGSITDKDTGTRKHDTSDTGNITTTRTGNIGVTSTQSLIQEQREVVKLNLMDVIIKDFIQRFCIGVY